MGMHRLVHLHPRAKRGDDDRRPPFDADLHIAFEARIGAAHDLIDGIGRGGPVRIGLIMPVERLGDALQPALQLDRLALPFAGVQRRKAADDAGGALRDHQIGIGDDEQRRAHGGNTQRPRDRG